MHNHNYPDEYLLGKRFRAACDIENLKKLLYIGINWKLNLDKRKTRIVWTEHHTFFHAFARRSVVFKLSAFPTISGAFSISGGRRQLTSTHFSLLFQILSSTVSLHDFLYINDSSQIFVILQSFWHFETNFSAISSNFKFTTGYRFCKICQHFCRCSHS